MSNLRVPFSASRFVPHFLLIHFDDTQSYLQYKMISSQNACSALTWTRVQPQAWYRNNSTAVQQTNNNPDKLYSQIDIELRFV